MGAKTHTRRTVIHLNKQLEAQDKSLHGMGQHSNKFDISEDEMK